MIDTAYCPISRYDIMYRELDDGCILYDASGLNVYTLNATAAYIWNCCDGTYTVKQTVEDLTDFCAIDADAALKHVTKTLEQFRERGLLDSME
jgi:hypothetical protein